MDEITSVQRALRHPGRHQSERPADFDRKQVADINRNARPTSSEYAPYAGGATASCVFRSIVITDAGGR
jgi:hypothetical protein